MLQVVAGVELPAVEQTTADAVDIDCLEIEQSTVVADAVVAEQPDLCCWLSHKNHMERLLHCGLRNFAGR